MSAKGVEEETQPQFDWIKLHNEIGGDISESTERKMKRKFLSNPFVPIGALLTVGALSAGLWSFRQGKQKMSQNMMRARIGAQGVTVIALICGVLFANKD